MRVLVTGASGMIGGAVARALLRRGHTVIGTVSSRQAPAGVQTIVADLFAGLPADDVDAVVHAASSNDERAAELDHAVIASVPRERRFVYTSGLWLHGDTGDSPATEDSPFAPPPVVAWRVEVERMIADANTVRIRPGLVYGGGRGYIPPLLAPTDGVVRQLGDGRWSVVHADDLGDLYALAVESAPAGSVYLGTLDEPVRVRDAAKVVAERHGAVVRDWDPADARQYWSVLVDAFLLDQVATGSRAREQLGWRPSRPTLLAELGG